MKGPQHLDNSSETRQQRPWGCRWRLNASSSLQFPAEQTSFPDNGQRLPFHPPPPHIPKFLSFGKKKAQQSYKYFNNVLRDQLFSVNKPNEAWLMGALLEHRREKGLC